MSRRLRRFAIVLGALAAAFVLLVIAAVLTLQSQWFYNKVRERIITAAEKATGGRVELGSFAFDWKHLQVDVRNFTLHGTEPEGSAPLIHADAASVGLKIISLLDRNINIQSLDVSAPRIHLIVEPGGATNIPHPKVSSHSGLNPLQTVLKLKAGRIALHHGIFDIEKHGSAPFDLAGQNLRLNLGFDPTVPRYRGDVAVESLRAAFSGIEPIDVNVAANVSVEGNRIVIDSANLIAGDSTIKASGSLEDWDSFHGAFHYDARSTSADITRIFHLKLLDSGSFQSTGIFTWLGGDDFAIKGRFNASNLSYRGPAIRLTNFRADGAIAATPRGPDLTNIRLSGALSLTPTPQPPPVRRAPRPARDPLVPPSNQNAAAQPQPSPPTPSIPLDAQITAAKLRGQELSLTGLAVAGLGGTFQGDAKISRFDRFDITGNLAGFDVKRAIAFYSPQPLPWDGLASGDAHLTGEFKNAEDLAIAANLDIQPADPARPVRGHVALNYNAGTRLLDLGQSTLTLPSSSATFSGIVGKTLRVHAATRDLNDILPALGESAAQFPVKIQNGQANFDGTVTGSLDQPHVQGHVTATGASYEGEAVDSLSADIDASASSVRVDSGALVRGNLRAQLQGQVALTDWKLTDASQIFGTATLQNAAIADLAAAAKLKDFPASGTVSATGQVSGTVSQPILAADVTAVNGVVRDEAFDRFTGHVTYQARMFQLANGALASGPKQIQLTASYQAQPDRLDAGRLQFRLASNVMPLEQVQTLEKLRPGAKGTLQVTANGAFDLSSVAGSESLRIADLHVVAAALGLQLDSQPLGDARLTADTQNGSLHAQVTSNFARSSIQGSGDWQLSGDYPGHAVLNFSQLDFTRLRDWLAPTAPAAPEGVIGSAEGQVTIDGPVLKPEAIQARLTIPKFTLSSKQAPGVTGGAFTLTNSGPIAASMVGSVVTIDSARFTARATDLSVTGKANFKAKSALDLHVAGNVDLAILHELDRDLDGAGSVSADATVRGDISSPQVNGRVQFQNAAFSIVDVPNGLTNASGTVLFAGNRATIQNFTGETGGGKVSLSGFATYANNEAVFRLHVQADAVRVRVQGFSIVANAGLNFTGTNENSMLTGTVTILRTSFNTESDFSSLIAGSAQPVRTPAARTGLLGGLGFDVQINTSPDIQVQTSLTQDLQLSGSLRLRGTASNPAAIGRVNITQGAVVFFGTRFTIGSGSVSFYNPVKIAPVLDVDLTTKARGVDVTLTISGPLDKLTLTPQSDPPLQFSEIVALLATGRTPTSDPALLTQSANDQPAFQQMGASALLGQAIASPVAGRLQRFFGVSKLRIDPTLPGVDVNPQARLTLEQQVTPNITFTYITNVTTTNPQVIQVEWAFNKNWSAVALREENGMTGLDFFFKKRF